VIGFATRLICFCAIGLVMAVGGARAEDAVVRAKALVAAASKPVRTWDGPTTGPKAVPGKTIAVVAQDLRNGGVSGVIEGVKEAAKVLGWTVHVLDGRASSSGIAAALKQVIASMPAGIVLVGVDAENSEEQVRAASRAGIVLVGWHSTGRPGPPADFPIFTNIATDPDAVGEVAASYVIASSEGKAGVVIFNDSYYAIARSKSNAIAATIKKCGSCELLSVEDSSLAVAATNVPRETASLLQRFGKAWTHSLGINDLYFDFIGPTLAQTGVSPASAPLNVSAGDGSQTAYQRIRNNQYQAATVPEPLRLHGWQLIDELNRAFAGQPWSGYMAPVHLVLRENLGVDGGPANVFDPDNGYRDAYKKIWGKK
jgi:ribose transport system substrate-binding protein